MPAGLSVTAVRHAVLLHISGRAVSLMLMCVRPCDRGLGDGEVERCRTGRVHVWHSWDIGTPPWVEKKGKKVRTMRERNPGRKFIWQQQEQPRRRYRARCFSLHGFGRLFSAFKDLKLQIQYFPSRFWEESADYMSQQAEKLSRHVANVWQLPEIKIPGSTP